MNKFQFGNYNGIMKGKSLEQLLLCLWVIKYSVGVPAPASIVFC